MDENMTLAEWRDRMLADINSAPGYAKHSTRIRIGQEISQFLKPLSITGSIGGVKLDQFNGRKYADMMKELAAQSAGGAVRPDPVNPSQFVGKTMNDLNHSDIAQVEKLLAQGRLIKTHSRAVDDLVLGLPT